MDESPSVSLKDRINALNLSQKSEPSPQKIIPRQITSIKTPPTSSTTSDKNIQNSPLLKALPKKIKNDPDDAEKTEDIYVKPCSRPVSGLKFLSANASDTTNKYPLHISAVSKESVIKATSSKKKEDFDDEDLTGSEIGEFSLYSDVPKNTPAFNLLMPTPATEDDWGVYATPRDLPVNPDRNQDRTIIPKNVCSRWQKLRQTIRDPNMRVMVDMSQLSSPINNDVTQDNDITSPTDAHKRRFSFGDDSNKKMSDDFKVKHPSLPAMSISRAENPVVDFPNQPTPLIHLYTESGASRDSSFKSDVSFESESLTDFSDTTSISSYELGRPRNFSDVSVTIDEDDYLSFKTVNNDAGPPHQVTIISLKEGVEHTKTLTVASEEDSTKPDVASVDQQALDVERQKKKTKKSKFKAALKGKLSKAVKHKKSTSSPTITSSPRNLPESPAKYLTSPLNKSPMMLNSGKQRIGNSPTAMAPMKRHGGSERHTANATSPQKIGNTDGSLENRRPKSMFPAFSSASPNPTTEMEGVYYDPSQPDDETDTLTIEVIRKEEDAVLSDYDDDGNRRYHDIEPLTFDKRSQSLGSLVDLDNTRKPFFTDKMSRIPEDFKKNFNYPPEEGVHPDTLMPPTPPPKSKSLRRKVERMLAESGYLMSSSNDTSPTHGMVKMRNNKSPDITERQYWHGGRPPSMPIQMPPAPPRPLSMPPDAPPDQPEILESDDNEYISPVFDINNDGDYITPEPPKEADYVSAAPNVERTPPKTVLLTHHTQQTSQTKTKTDISPSHRDRKTLPSAAYSSENEDSIYHTVDDLNENTQTKSTTQNQMDVPENHTAQLARFPVSTKPMNHNVVNRTFRKSTEKENPHPLQSPGINTKSEFVGKPNYLPANVSSLRSTRAKPVLPGKPYLDIAAKPAPKLPPKPGMQYAALNSSTIPENKNERHVVPPPRPSKPRKFRPPSEKNDSTDGSLVLAAKIPSKSAAIAELENILSKAGPVTPKLFKPPAQNHKKNDLSSTTNENVTERGQEFKRPIVTAEKNHSFDDSNSNLAKPVPLSRRSLSVDVISSATSTSEATASKQDTMPKEKSTVVLIKATLQSTASKVDTEANTSGIRTATRRPAAKRPTTAPPQRPTAPPPPPPQQIKGKENNRSTPQKAPKPKPPSRPPPPSSEKIKAAEERRQLQISEKEDEDLYNDSSIKHTEYYTYSFIEDVGLQTPPKNNPAQTTVPTPPGRPKHAMKRAVQTAAIVTSFQARQEKLNVEKNMLEQGPFVTQTNVYNGAEEERVYARIDDL